jgi:hypothetical protein
MKMWKKLISLLTVFSLCVSLFQGNFVARAASNIDDIKAELIMYYQTYQDAAQTDIDRLLDDMAEISGSIYFINYNNGLIFKRLRDTSLSLNITKSDYFNLTSKNNIKLKSIAHITELGENSKAGVSGEGETQYMKENCFINNNSNASALVSKITSYSVSRKIQEFNLSWRGNYLLELVDQITIETKDNSTITTYIINDSYVYNGGFKEETSWSYTASAAVNTNPATISEAFNQTTARVDKINKQITLIAADANEARETAASIELTVDEINLSVEEFKKGINEDIETINSNIALNTDGVNIANSKIDANTEAIGAININNESITSTITEIEKNTNTTLENINDSIATLESKIEQTAADLKIEFDNKITTETDSVTTSTGFTFNKDGLTVEKSGSEIKTQITEDGMRVYRNNTAMLTANNQGVNATNLHATTYLIIGNNSRFEDMGSSRTGCFWIGG